jgi:hypothetical protein
MCIYIIYQLQRARDVDRPPYILYCIVYIYILQCVYISYNNYNVRVTWIGLAQDSDDDSDLVNCKVRDAPIHLDVSCHKM